MFNNKIKLLDLSNNVKYINIIDFINGDSPKIRTKYLSIIQQLDKIKIQEETLRSHYLYKKNYNLWEMSSVIEKSTLKKNKTNDLLKFIALQEILNQSEVKEITLFDCNKNVPKIFDNQKIKINKKFSFTQFFSYFEKSSFFVILKYLIFLLRNFSFIKQKYELKKNSIFFLSYYAHLNKGKEHTSWGKLYKKYNLNNNFFYFFLPSRKNFFFKNQNYFFINNFFQYRDFFQIIKNFFCYKKKFKMVKNQLFNIEKNTELKNACMILQNDIEESLNGFLLLENLTWITLFDRMMSEVPFQRKGIYIYENQPWERAFINAWKKYNHGELYGFVTASIHYWLLSYLDTNYLLSSRPKYVICSSEFTKLSLKENNFDENSIIINETLKYDKIYKKQKIINKLEKKNLVVFGDYFRPINENLLNIINKISLNKDIIQKYKLYFKPHPENYYWKLNKKIEVINNKNDISFSVAICPNTSIVSIELIDSEIKTLIYKDNNFVDLSPLKNQDESFKRLYFNNSHSLQLLLTNDDNNLNIQKLNYFLKSENLSNWENLLND